MIKGMKSSLLYYLRYTLFLLGIQSLFRILFLIIYSSRAQGIELSDQLMAMLHGLNCTSR